MDASHTITAPRTELDTVEFFSTFVRIHPAQRIPNMSMKLTRVECGKEKQMIPPKYNGIWGRPYRLHTSALFGQFAFTGILTDW
jgi:hypothetical protein